MPEPEVTPAPTTGQCLAALPARGKEPASARILTAWVEQTKDRVGLDGARLRWLIASTVVVAVLQRSCDGTGRPRFLLKGGTYLQHRMNWGGRATRDVDGLIRGDLEEFLADLDRVLQIPWGPLSLIRTEVELIRTPLRVIKPRRFNVKVQLRGITWGNIQIEVSPDEGGASIGQDELQPPDLKSFGLPTPDRLVGIAVRYQIAQKLHACTDPHDPPGAINDRARDVVDLLLLREFIGNDADQLVAVQAACRDIFEARAADAVLLGLTPRAWPAPIVAHPHWAMDYGAAAKGVVDMSLAEAVETLNQWVASWC